MTHPTRRALLEWFAGAAALPSGASRHDAHLAAVERALSQAGGLGGVRRGDRVLLKVNTNSGDPYPYSTSPKVVAALASQLTDRGAKVFVGDRSFWGDGNTWQNLVANGIAAAAKTAGATLVVFEDDDTNWLEIDDELVPSWVAPVRLPRLAVEADHLLNLACVKTHFITGCTLGLKNLLGLVSAGDRARPGNLRTHHAMRIHRQIAELHRVLKPRLTVIDGFEALVSGGPTPKSGAAPTIVRTGVVLASADRIAVEIAAIRLLQKFAPKSEAIHATSPELHPTVVATRAVLRS